MPPLRPVGQLVSGEVIAAGGTLTVLDAVRAPYELRLHGVDCLDAKPAFGPTAPSEPASGKEVEVEVTDQDRYGRRVGGVTVGTTDVNRKMMWAGTRGGACHTIGQRVRRRGGWGAGGEARAVGS